MRRIVIEDHFASWRAAALRALGERLAPEAIEWRAGDVADLPQDQAALDYSEDHGQDHNQDHGEAPGKESTGGAASAPGSPPTTTPPPPPLHVSKEFSALLHDAALYRDPQRWAFLYKVLWRWQQGDRSAASPADVDGARLYHMAKRVRRAKHDMIAYVRFRKQQATASSTPEYIAWYEPEHDVLPWAAEHFAQRMGAASWLIATPHGAAFWDGSQLHVDRQRAVEGEHRCETDDEAEALWLTYYRSTFNPARLNETALEQHMPVRFWKGLPEGQLIPGMISEAKSGARRIAQASSVGELDGKAIPVEAESAQPLRALPSSLDACRRCDLWRQATQAVPGAGPPHARVMLLGEQPGDQEDLNGKPFVGPAGQLLDVAMQRAGLVRKDLYLTNAVKHFKWEPRGKRRLHKTPAQREVEACAHWLDQELQTIQPSVIVALGATALSALLQRKVALRDYLGTPFQAAGRWVVATYHPSFALRQSDDAAREKVLDEISKALTRAQELAGEQGVGQ